MLASLPALSSGRLFQTQNCPPLTPLYSTLTRILDLYQNKALIQNLSLLESTLTKNRGGGHFRLVPFSPSPPPRKPRIPIAFNRLRTLLVTTGEWWAPAVPLSNCVGARERSSRCRRASAPPLAFSTPCTHLPVTTEGASRGLPEAVALYFRHSKASDLPFRPCSNAQVVPRLSSVQPSDAFRQSPVTCRKPPKTCRWSPTRWLVPHNRNHLQCLWQPWLSALRSCELSRHLFSYQYQLLRKDPFVPDESF